jgi:hypothetical protein
MLIVQLHIIFYIHSYFLSEATAMGRKANFRFHTVAIFLFYFPQKLRLTELNVFNKIFCHAKCQDNTVSGASVASASDILTAVILVLLIIMK